MPTACLTARNETWRHGIGEMELLQPILPLEIFLLIMWSRKNTAWSISDYHSGAMRILVPSPSVGRMMATSQERLVTLICALTIERF